MSVSSKGFLAILPAIIISALLFIISVKASATLLALTSQINARTDRLQANHVVDSCFNDLHYHLEQGELLPATTTYFMGDYACQISTNDTGQAYFVTASSTVFNSNSRIEAIISKSDLSVSNQKMF